MSRRGHIVAIVPARKGSKGIKGKALRNVGGKSLIAHAALCARSSRYIDYACISTDCKTIAKEAQKNGLDVPFLRPEKIALDKTPMIDVLVHALDNLPEQIKPELIVLLQPTSPLRTTRTVDRCIKEFLKSGAKCAASVSRSKITPFWMRKINSQKRLEKIAGFKKDITSRQSAPDFFHFNGAVYITTPELIKKHKTILDAKPLALEINDIEAIDIDTVLDLELARAAFRMKKKK